MIRNQYLKLAQSISLRSCCILVRYNLRLLLLIPSSSSKALMDIEARPRASYTRQYTCWLFSNLMLRIALARFLVLSGSCGNLFLAA